MAQLIAPEVWQMGIDDNRLLPGRYTTGLFTGSGVKIANNASACRVWDIQISDYITTYDDRRVNGLAGPRGNSNGNDGWAASAYGVFQDVRFDSRVYTMGRHRSIAMRVYDEMQYAGNIGEWGDASMSYEVTNGNSLMQTAAILSKARELWEKQILGPDIDRYNLFCACNGHISGRAICGESVTSGGTTTWVSLDDQIFVNDASKVKWIAQPGMVQGESIPPRFAPIHAIQWDDDNIPLLLQNIKVTWNELHIPETQRVICIDPFYEYRLLSVLTGAGIPATDSAYSDIQNGSFTRLMGWDFNFEIPSSYWPKIYVDDNMNVVHSKDGGEAYDSIINSVDADSVVGLNPDAKLLYELGAADRMSRMNFVRTEWIPASGGTPAGFKKIITNYPLGEPAYNGYYGLESAEIGEWYAYEGTEQYASTNPNVSYVPRQIIPDSLYGVYHATTGLPGKDYPWAGPGVGYGLLPHDVNEQNPGDNMATGPQITGGEATLAQVIGLALYKPAVQLSQEYSSMVTDDGGTRGKFSEMCMDIKYDAWVIEQFAAGVIPIIAGSERKTYSIPVSIVDPVTTISQADDDGGADDGGNDNGGGGGGE